MYTTASVSPPSSLLLTPTINLNSNEIISSIKELKSSVSSSPLTLYDKKMMERVKHIEIIYYQLITEDANLVMEIKSFENSSTRNKAHEITLRRKMIELEEMKRKFQQNLSAMIIDSQPRNGQFERNVKAIKGYEESKEQMISKGNLSLSDAITMEESLLLEKKKLKAELAGGLPGQKDKSGAIL